MVASSGMSAISTALMAFLQAGDHLLMQNTCYGGTFDFVTKNLPAWNISHTIIDARQPDTWQAALKPSSKVIFLPSEAAAFKTQSKAQLEHETLEKPLQLVVGTAFRSKGHIRHAASS